MKIIGAIDIGSNAIRMICARLTPDRRIELVESVRTPLRLGLDVFKFGYLQEVTINNLVESIEIFQRTLSQNKCEQIRAYGTSALREADNADELISKIERIISKDTIISSSTSSFMPSELQNVCTQPERVIVGHPMNPPHLIWTAHLLSPFLLA